LPAASRPGRRPTARWLIEDTIDDVVGVASIACDQHAVE
jgi:hypothetical protein